MLCVASPLPHAGSPAHSPRRPSASCVLESIEIPMEQFANARRLLLLWGPAQPWTCVILSFPRLGLKPYACLQTSATWYRSREHPEGPAQACPPPLQATDLYLGFLWVDRVHTAVLRAYPGGLRTFTPRRVTPSTSSAPWGRPFWRSPRGASLMFRTAMSQAASTFRSCISGTLYH